MLRVAGICALSVLAVLLVFQVWSFWKEEKRLAAELGDVETRLYKSEQGRDQLKAQIDYYQNPENLEKELRRRFNYRSPDEKLMIIVPPTSTANASSS